MACKLSLSLLFFFFLVDKGSLADESGATGQRKGAAGRDLGGGGSVIFFFPSERPFHCLLLP